MVLKKRRVVAALRKKGFEKDKDGKHIVLAYRFLDGTPSKIKTHVSHGSKRSDLSDHLIAEMSRQIKLPKGSRKNKLSGQSVPSASVCSIYCGLMV